jgi:hypothetical protein
MLARENAKHSHVEMIVTHSYLFFRVNGLFPRRHLQQLISKKSAASFSSHMYVASLSACLPIVIFYFSAIAILCDDPNGCS